MMRRLRGDRVAGAGIWILALINLGFAQSETAWRKIDDGLSGETITCLRVHPGDQHVLVAGTSDALLLSLDSGRSYRTILRIPNLDPHDVLLSGSAFSSIYAATAKGLFFSSNQGQTFERVFSGFGDAASAQCQSVVEINSKIYLATLAGLFFRPEATDQWQKMPGILGNHPVYRLAVEGGDLYAATASSVYRVDGSTGEIEEVMGFTDKESPGMMDEEGQFFEGSERSVWDLKVHSGPESVIFLAAEQGIYLSSDRGIHWQKIDDAGLPINKVRALAVVSGLGNGSLKGEAGLDSDTSQMWTLWAGTEEGVFQKDRHSWRQSYAGLENNRISAIESSGKALYAITDRGLFQLSLSGHPSEIVAGENDRTASPFRRTSVSDKTTPKEPLIRDVQRMAVAYADVHPDKIKKWQKQARLKGLVPNLSVGVDRAATELYHWDTGSTPDRLIKGREYQDWDVSLTWDLSSMVWSADQTSIDSRSKLMVELREDILDQVTRLYFERKRLQMNLTSIKGLTDSEIQEREMRIEELTALIDGLTGGEFTRAIHQ